MHKILDDILSEDCSMDSWYDEGCIYAESILNKFTSINWVEIENLFKNRADDWKIKLAYIIDSSYGVNGLSILLGLLENGNTELIVTCLDSLRDFKIDKFKHADVIKETLLTKLELVSDTSSMPVKMVLNDLVNKLNHSKAKVKTYTHGISKFPKLEKIVPLPFHEKTNQFITDYKELTPKQLWEKYNLQSIWFHADDYIKVSDKHGTLGTLLINVLAYFGFILQLDYKEELSDYEVENFWGDEPVKLVQFDLENDQNYYAYIPQSTDLKSIFDTKIYDVDELTLEQD